MAKLIFHLYSVTQCDTTDIQNICAYEKLHL